jgi:hypothetical protein
MQRLLNLSIFTKALHILGGSSSHHQEHITNYSHQDATYLEFIHFYISSTCFRWFLRLSSGAHKLQPTRCNVYSIYPFIQKLYIFYLGSSSAHHQEHITNYSHQDAKYLEFIHFYISSTCFRWFLRPSSGAHNKLQRRRYNVS